MENVTLRDGEIAILESGTRIMNVNTFIELMDKLEEREAENEEDEAEAAAERAREAQLMAAFVARKLLG